MVRRPHARRLAVAVVVAVSAGFITLTGPSNADVTAVRGEAFAMSASVSLFGGPFNERGPVAHVTLPPGGSAVPITATAENANAIFGPATIFSSGPVTTSTQGTTGPGGSVTSTATLAPVNTSQSEVFTADSISSTCTASETGVSGSTTVVNGTIILQDPNPDVEGEAGEEIVNIPLNPAPNTTYSGTVANVNDNFDYVFNEQIVNPDGSITVRAAHLYLLGPTAVGDVIIGEVTCGVTATTTSTSTTSTSTSTTSTSTSTTSTSTTSTSTTSTSTTSTSTTSTSTTSTSTTSTSTTSTTQPTTTSTTSTSTTSTTQPTTTSTSTTSTTISGDACVDRLEAVRAQANSRLDLARAQIIAAVPPGPQRDAYLAQIEASRAQVNAQINQAIAACP